MRLLSFNEVFEAAKNPDDKCVICKGPWHPATGQLVGSPMQVKVCGACFKNEIVPLIKDTMDRDIRLSSRTKREAATQRKETKKRVREPRVSFYQHAATSIGAGENGDKS